MSKIESLVINKMKELKLTLSTAESLTSGMIGSKIGGVSGASKVYKGGIISYFLEVKENELGISKKILGEDAVNYETAKLMAKNISIKLNTDIGISTTGIAEQYDERHPQAFFSIYDKNRDTLKHCNGFLSFKKDKTREEVREEVSNMVLKALDAYLKIEYNK